MEGGRWALPDETKHSMVTIAISANIEQMIEHFTKYLLGESFWELRPSKVKYLISISVVSD